MKAFEVSEATAVSPSGSVWRLWLVSSSRFSSDLKDGSVRESSVNTDKSEYSRFRLRNRSHNQTFIWRHLNQRRSWPGSVSSLTKSEVFRCFRNWSDDVGKRSLGDWGNLFQFDGPTTLKFLDWVIDVRVRGTTKWPKPRTEEWND